MKRWKNRPEGSNWGDFGEDDQKGRMNLLTPELRRAALREATEGIAFCLSLPLDYPGGAGLISTRKAPRLFADNRPTGHRNYNFRWSLQTCQCEHVDVTSDDAVLLYTQYSTQWDSLAHYGQLFDADGDGEPEIVYYNGYRAEEDIVSPDANGEGPRARALGIENLAEAGAQGRGTLVDLHAVYGRQHVSVGYDDLMRIMEQQKAEVKVGDFLCLYTGFADMLLEMKRNPDSEVLHKTCAGLDGSDTRLQQWITDSGLVAICADNTAVEGRPLSRPTGPRPLLPLHAHCLFKQGIHLGELWYFKELAEWLAAHGRRHFLLTAPSLRLPGSVGSPVTPIATV